MCASCSNTTSFLGWHIYLLKLEIKHSIDFPSAIRRKLNQEVFLNLVSGRL